jgi:hypothetical protein
MNKATFEAQEDLQAVEAEEAEDQLNAEENDLVATVATVGVVAIGAAVVEAALLPGLALGVAAVAAPRFLPKLGSALGPAFKSTVRGVYKLGQKTKEFVAETNEHVQDIVAECDAEAKSKDAAEKEAAPSV